MQNLLAGCLAVLLAPSAVPSSQAPEDRGEIIGKRYDLSHLTLSVPELQCFEQRVSLLPLMRSGSSLVDREQGDGGTVNSVVDSFVSSCEVEFEAIEILDGHRLYLESTASGLAAFEAYLTEWTDAVQAAPTLHLTTVELTGEAAQTIMTGTRFNDRDLASWGDDVLAIESRAVRVPESGIHRFADTTSHTVLTGISSEVASGSAIFDPNVRDVATGTTLFLAAHRIGPGVEVAYTAIQTRREDVDVGEGIVGEFSVASEGGTMRHTEQVLWKESFGVVGGSMTGRGRLSRGEHLVLATGSSEGTTLCTVVSLSPGSEPSRVLRRLSESEGTTIVAMPAGVLNPVTTSPEWCDWGGSTTLEADPVEALEEDRWILSTSMGAGSQSVLVGLLDTIEILGDYEISDQRCIVAPAEESARIKGWLDAEASALPAQLHVRVSSQDALGRAHRGGCLSMLSGTSGSLVSGQERLIAKKADVEIAQHSSMTEPGFVVHFEGLALRMELAQLPGGQVAYRISGQLSTDLDISEGAASRMGSNGLLTVTTDRLLIQESGLAAKGAGDEAVILIGDRRKQGAFVEVRVTAI